MSAKKVIKAIKSYSKFLITSHIDIEADALGSELALKSLLKKLGKKAYIINNDDTPYNCRFLPGSKNIYHQLTDLNFQAVLIVDCPNKQRIGNVVKLLDQNKPIINIDHHIGNSNFGKINWVDPQASSAGEMIYHLFRLTKTKLDKNDALNIYTAILTDTGSFTHSNTTSTAFYISSQLVKLGIEPDKTYAKIYENNSAQDLITIARLISSISFSKDNTIAWVKINKNLYRKAKNQHEMFDRILNFAKSVKTVKVIIIFYQIDSHLTKLSLRSKSPIDVRKIAKLFGGGGHRRASGCVIKANLDKAEQLVLRQAKKAL